MTSWARHLIKRPRYDARMGSRKTFIWVAIALAALVVVFGVISLVTGNAGFILWAIAPIGMALATVAAAIRGATKGELKRDRDARVVARKAEAKAQDRAANESSQPS